MVAEVKSLSETVSVLNANRAIQPGNESANVNSPTVSASAIRKEMRELYERDKRKCSIIIRGVTCLPLEGVRSLFGEICGYLDHGSIQLEELTRVNSNICRAKVISSEERLRLLSNVSRLKDSPLYKNIFIQKDLTFAQRVELLDKRKAKNLARSRDAASNVEDHGRDASIIPGDGNITGNRDTFVCGFVDPSFGVGFVTIGTSKCQALSSMNSEARIGYDLN